MCRSVTSWITLFAVVLFAGGVVRGLHEVIDHRASHHVDTGHAEHDHHAHHEHEHGRDRDHEDPAAPVDDHDACHTCHLIAHFHATPLGFDGGIVLHLPIADGALPEPALWNGRTDHGKPSTRAPPTHL